MTRLLRLARLNTRRGRNAKAAAADDPVPEDALPRTLGAAAASPRFALAALILINAAGAGAFAWALTAILVGKAPWLALAGLVAALAMRAVAGAGMSRLGARHAQRVKSLTRRKALAAVLGRIRGEAASIGEAAGAVVDEVEALDGYFSRFEPAALEARIGPPLIAGLAALASPIAAGILVATLIPFAAIMALAGGAAAAQARRQFEALAGLSGRFVDRVRGLPVILAFQAQDAETAGVAAAARDVGARTLSVLRIAFVSSAALEFFAALAVALVAVYCGFTLLGLMPFRLPGRLDFPRAFFALVLAPEFYAPLRRLAAAYHEKQLGEAAAARLAPLLAAEPPPQRPELSPGSPVALAAPPEVRLHALTLRLGDILPGPIDAVFPAGALTVLTGPTGAGKSSLLAAIVGLTSADSGQIEITGIPQSDHLIGSSPRAENHSTFAISAWAGQAPAFLPGTILENLMAASPCVTREAALAMADRVGLSAALAGRSAAGDTILDERGSGLSGGERRRLALARALLKPAPLLLLDEPTADLDAGSQAEIIALIRAALPGRTIIVATHSEALTAAADHVVRLR